MSVKQTIKYVAIALVVFFCVGFYHNHIEDTPQTNQRVMAVSHKSDNQISQQWYNQGPQPLHPIQRIEYNVKSGFNAIF